MLMFFVLIVIVAGIIYLQYKFFNSTRVEIEELKSFFPSIDKVALKECTINKSAITDRRALHRVVQNPPQKKEADEMTSDDVNVSLITTNYGSKGFKDVVIETNKYLCKNVGTSADLGILQDICDKELEVKENSIKRSLNLPLFLGLGGTFIGIIFGIIGFLLDIESLFGTSSSNNEANGLLFLLMGIAAAMCASFVGLVLMVWNTSFNYKKATVGLDTKRNEYFDFLRRELMPTLANSMSSSLNSLKGVLGHFVDKFGKNLDAYADSAELLNENLEKQHLVLTQIQNMGMTRMAKHVTTAFDQLHKSADALNVFYQYLNSAA